MSLLLEAAKIVPCILWLLLCLRCYTFISRDNPWQRRFIAMGAGLGAGLIYLLATMIISVLTAQTSHDTSAPGQSDEVRVQAK